MIYFICVFSTSQEAVYVNVIREIFIYPYSNCSFVSAVSKANKSETAMAPQARDSTQQTLRQSV